MKLIQRKIKFTWCKCYINFYLSRVSHQVAIVLFLLKHISELRYIFPYPIWGQSFVSPSQPNAGYVHAAVSWKRKQLLSKQITQSYQQGNMPWKYEAIFVYKQAEKALTPISHLLCCLFFYDNILIIIFKKRSRDRCKLKYVLWIQACSFGTASLQHPYIRFHVLVFR